MKNYVKEGQLLIDNVIARETKNDAEKEHSKISARNG